MHMRDFYVVGSNLSFPLSPPGPMNGTMYELCGQYPGAPPDGSLARITCQPQPMIAQYVYIQAALSPIEVAFNFCEVRVYGDKYVVNGEDCVVVDDDYADKTYSCFNQEKRSYDLICCITVFSLSCHDVTSNTC